MRRLWSAGPSICLLLIFAFTSCDALPQAVREQHPMQSDACDFFDKTTDMQTIWQGVIPEIRPDVQWRIPSEYLRRNYGGQSDGAILLRIRVTDFAPFVPEPAGQRTEITDNSATFLLTTIGDLDLNMLFAVGLTLDVDTEIDPIPVMDLAKPFEYGLLRFDPNDFDRRAFTTVGAGDLLIARRNNSVTDMIRCNAVGSVPSPGCTHTIRTDHMDVKMSYRRTHLQDWQQIHRRASKFVSCAFMQKAN